jgi:formate dehydrogenase major subunit
MSNSVAEFENAKLLFVIGSNTTEAHPVISYYIKRAAKKGAVLIVSDPRRIDLCRWATLHVPIKPGTDVAYLNGLMREILVNGWHDPTYIQENTEGYEEFRKGVEPYTLAETTRITGVPEDTIKEVARLLGANKPGAVIYTLGITEHTCGTDNVKSLANLQLLLGGLGQLGGGVNPLRGQNNVQGACDVGVLPNVYPAYQPVTDTKAREKFERAWGAALPQRNGLTMPDMFGGILEGKIKALYIYGENVLLTEPNMGHTQHCLEECEFVIVGDIFFTETAPYADVVFPDHCWGEEDGTFTNTERRVNRVRAALKAPGEARSHWWVLNELGKRMGMDLHLTSAHAIYEELRQLAPSYGGITWERIENVGLQWPCPTLEHPGTPILHKDGRTTRGRGLFHAIEHRPPAETEDLEYPFILSTGRRLWQYHTGTQTHNSGGVDELCPEEWLEISPADAERMEIKSGDWVRARSRRGAIELRAWITDRSPAGVCWTSFHFAAACANALTIDAYDSVTKTAEYKVCAIQVEKVSSGAPLGDAFGPARQARP